MVVIGAGQAGLSSAGALRRQGFDANGAGQAAARSLRRLLRPVTPRAA